MMKNEMKTNNKTVLLAILAVFAMVAAGAAVVMASDGVDAAADTNVPEVTADITGTTDLSAAAAGAKYTVSSAEAAIVITLPAANAITLFIKAGLANTVTLTQQGDDKHSGAVTVYVMTGAGTDVDPYKYYSKYKVEFAADNNETATHTAVLTVPEIANDTPKITTNAVPTLNPQNALTLAEAVYTFIVTGTDVTLDNTTTTLAIPKGAKFNGDLTAGTNKVSMSKVGANGFGSTTTAITLTYAASTLTLAGTPDSGLLMVTGGTMTYTAAPAVAIGFVGGVMAAPFSGENAVIYASINDAKEAALAAYVIYGVVTQTSNISISENLTIAANSKFVIPSKYAVTVAVADKPAAAPDAVTIDVAATGAIDVYGKLIGKMGKNVTTPAQFKYPVFGEGTGAVNLYKGSQMYDIGAGSAAITDAIDADVPTVVSGKIEQNLSFTDVQTGGALEITKGYTMTVSGLFLLQHDITVNGTLVITSTGSVGSSIAGHSITLGPSGKIENSGVIGKNVPINFKAADVADAYVQIRGVAGADVAYSTSGPVLSGTVTPVSNAYMGLTGDATTLPLVPYVQVDLATIKTTTMTAGTELKVDDGASNVTGTLTIAGTGAMGADKIKVMSGATLAVTGKIAGTVDFVAGDNQDSATYKTVGMTMAIATGIGGFTAGVVKQAVTYIDGTGAEKTYYNYRVVLDGTLVTSKAEGNDTLTFAPTVANKDFVLVSGELTVPANITLAGAVFYVTGSITAAANLADLVVVGGTYSAGATPVYYADSILDSIAMIGLAANNTVAVHAVPDNGKEVYAAEIDSDITFLKDYRLVADGAALIIPEGKILTVNEGAIVDAEAIAAIDGMLVVMKGGVCDPDAGLYDVTYGNEEYTIYCGFQTALDNAEPGDTIEFSGTRTFLAENNLESLVVPAGVKLSVSGTLEILRSLTVSADATVEVTGTMNIGQAGANGVKGVKLQVAGTADFTGGKTAIVGKDADNKAAINATGTIKYVDASFDFGTNVVVNGYMYTNTDKYITTLEKAVESGKAITITGNVSDSSTIVLKANLTIAEGATAQLGTIEAKGYTVTATGALSAVITGVTGTDDAASIIATEFKGAIQNTATASVYSMKINAFTAGGLTVASGTASIGGNFAGEDTYLAVADGAILALDTANNYAISTTSQLYGGLISVLKGQLTINTGELIAITGDAFVDEGAELVIDEEAAISGDVEVFGALTISADVALLGNIMIDDSEDSTATATTADNAAIVMGVSDIGAGAAIYGKLVLAGTSYIKAFPGSSISDATLEFATKVTVAYVNSVEYCTVVATSANVLLNGIINDDIEMSGYDMTGVNVIANWKDIKGDDLDALASKVGNPEFAYFESNQMTATVRVSVATGMSIYVDGVKYASGTDIRGVSMGTHTVMVTVNPGYKYADGTSATITFDGKVLSGILAFTITADMVGDAEHQVPVVLSAIGDIVVDQPDIPEQEKKDDSMIMILLGILVVMVVILAIVTVIRMMRS